MIGLLNSATESERIQRALAPDYDVVRLEHLDTGGGYSPQREMSAIVYVLPVEGRDKVLEDVAANVSCPVIAIVGERSGTEMLPATVETLASDELNPAGIDRTVQNWHEKQKQLRQIRLMMANADHPVLVGDEHGRIVFQNVEALRTLGRLGSDENLSEILRDTFAGAFVLRAKGNGHTVVPPLGRDIPANLSFRGAEANVNLSTSLVSHSSGFYYIVALKGLSQPRHAETGLNSGQMQLERALQMHEAILNCTADGLCVLTYNWDVEFLNPAFGKMLGLEAKQLHPSASGESSNGSAENFASYFQSTEQFEDFRHAALNSLWSSPKPVPIPVELVHSDGHAIACEISIVRQMQSATKAGFVATITDITEHRRTERLIQRQLERLHALRTVDLAINGSLDLRVTLQIVVEQAVSHLEVDAADVLVLNPATQILDYMAGHGFRTSALQQTHLRIGEGHAGKAAIERKTLHIPNLAGTKDPFANSPELEREGFICYFAVPLVAKGKVTGVLEVFKRSPIHPQAQWTDFLETIAGQAAIAIDSSLLFSDLQKSNTELTLAYDTTLEGWSRALEMRDIETHGHTMRVTELAVRLGREMGMRGADLVHLRRGALLHDIGKMGIPDSILLKPGPLDESEWQKMRLHTIYAYELLIPIHFLRPALDIPYCHHEKWDGTGYPRGLKGEQIPLAARIFAATDVWDALQSERPYRRPWPVEKVINYIESFSGSHFDPQVVTVFLEMIRAGLAAMA